MTGQHSRESPISIIFPSQAISPRIPQKGQALGQCADLPKVKDTIPGMNFIANQVTLEEVHKSGGEKVSGCYYLI